MKKRGLRGPQPEIVIVDETEALESPRPKPGEPCTWCDGSRCAECAAIRVLNGWDRDE